MIYNVVIPKNLLKFFDKIDLNTKSKIKEKLQNLKENPFPIGSIKLKGFNDQYRIRFGDYRIRYFINFINSEILILDIAHRKDIYKKK